MVDTAGLRDTEDEVEAEGVRRALAAAEQADLHVAVVDALVRAPCGRRPQPARRSSRCRTVLPQQLVGDDAFPDLAATLARDATVVVLNKVDAFGEGAHAEQLARATSVWRRPQSRFAPGCSPPFSSPGTGGRRGPALRRARLVH